MKVILILAVIAIGIGVFGTANKKKVSAMTLDDFIRESKEIAYQHKKEKERISGSKPMGIKCTVSSDDENVISIMEMYSIDDNKQWTKSTITHKKAVSEFSDDSATQEKIRKVRTNPMKFNI